MSKSKPLLLIVSGLIVLAVPVVLFSEQRQDQFESMVASESFQTNLPMAAITIIGLFAADIFLPIPSSAVCAVAGKIFGLVVGTILCWLGLNLSSLIGYMLGRSVGWSAVRRFSNEAAVADVKDQIDRWGIWPLISFRPLPVLAEASILFLGMYRYPGRKFWPAIIFANFFVSLVFVGLGKWFADQQQFVVGLIVCCAIPPILLLIWSLFNKRTGKSGPV